jgi:V8-like Glu-specific endopeptidase
MNKPLIGALATLLLTGASVATTGVAQASGPPSPTAVRTQQSPRQAPHAPKDVDFSAIVALDDCSGSLIRFPSSTDDDPAVVMTNGHCLESGMPGAGEVIVNQSSSRTFTLLNPDASELGTLQGTQIMYGTMTQTDVALYQLNTSYAQIKQQYHTDPLELSPDHPTAGTQMSVVSGYWKKTYNCTVDGFVHELHEQNWIWKDSVRYSPECHVIGGTSGSPVEDVATRKVIAINNTTNESGEQCTLNNPCEVDENGQTTVHQGIGYAEETYYITKCIAKGNQLDLSLPGCELPKPAGYHHH